MTLNNRYERRHAQSAPPPNPITDDDLHDIGETVTDLLDHLRAADKTPRGTKRMNDTMVKETMATVAAHLKPSKHIAFTADSYQHGRLFQPDITRNIQGARRIADTFNRHYLQAQLGELTEWDEKGDVYGHNRQNIGEYLLDETTGQTDHDPYEHSSS